MPARLRMGVLTGLAALASILLLSACGRSSKPESKASAENSLIAFSKCMREHGVTHFPDPSGHGINFAGTGVSPRSPSFQAAQRVCSKLLPGGGPQGHKATAQQIRQADETAQCMRAHGVSGFPDPIISQEPPTALNPSNYSSIQAGGGMIIAIPKSIDERSPAFRKAAATCGF